MKILVVAPTPFFSDRGTHIRILEEALALEKLGHTITIATYHIGKDVHTEIETKIDIRRIRRLLFWYKKLEAGPDWQKIILDLMLIRKVFFLARTQRPDIIHGHLHEGILIGWIVQKILFWRHIKLVADFHGSLTKEMSSHGYLKRGLMPIFALVEKIINRLGDFAITSSWEMTREIEGYRPKDNVETVTDGTNLDNFNIKESKREIRLEMELPENKLIVTYAGGLVPNKGIGYLFDAIKIISEKTDKVFFLLGGFPAEHAEKIIQKKQIEKSLRLVVPLNYFELPRFHAAADVAIDPKDSDTSQASGKMLNYLSAGLPVICFDKPNNRKFLGEGGYFCSDISAEKIAEGILFFLDNPSEIEKMGRLNREKAQEFSWKKSAIIINNIYKKICSGEQIKQK